MVKLLILHLVSFVIHYFYLFLIVDRQWIECGCREVPALFFIPFLNPLIFSLAVVRMILRYDKDSILR